MRSTKRELPAYVLADRARRSATRADTAVWALQLRAWPQGVSSAHDDVEAALLQSANHLRAAADTLDPPSLVTYASPIFVRSAIVSFVVMLAGVVTIGQVLSGLTMACVMGAYVSLVFGLDTVYFRWAVRRGPRNLQPENDPDPVTTAAELPGEISALIEALGPRHGRRRARAEASLRAAAQWAGLAAGPAATSPAGEPPTLR